MHHWEYAAIAIALPALMLAGCARDDRAGTRDTTHEGRLAPRLRNLGDLHHRVTTESTDAQAFFDQGLTLVYAFNHAEAQRSFREAARLDPGCAMAYWGQALALSPNINDSAIGPDRERQGREAIAEAAKREAQAGEQEKALIEALSARFSSDPERRKLNEAYAVAMRKVYARFPQDPDVAALYADAVMNTMPWNYWDKAGKPRPGVQAARGALEGAIRSHPGHPGANHLYIHLMEASEEVDLAVPSADRLGGLVPAAGHLVHMPGHVYIRVGRYSDAAAANVKAIAADEDYITQCRAQGIYPAAYYPHNIHFLNAALIMDGRSGEALEAARKLGAQHSHEMLHEPGFGFAHVMKAVPDLTMVRFGRWQDILRAPAPPADQVFGRAMHAFARGFALSATGKPREAAAELAELKKLGGDPGLADMKIMDLNSLADLTQIATVMLEGDLALKAGNHKAAVAAFRRAVALDDALLYSEPPDWMLPPRQYLAHALLASGNPPEAERVYREDLKRHRANGWSLFGLRQALQAQAKTDEAAEARRKFTRAWARADVQLPGSRF